MTSRDADRSFVLRDLIPALVLLVIVIFGLAAAILAPKGQFNQYVVMVAPWRSMSSVLNIIHEADGSVVSFDDGSGLITVYSENKDFPSRLYSAGLWLVFEPMQPGGCLGIEQRTIAS